MSETPNSNLYKFPEYRWNMSIEISEAAKEFPVSGHEDLLPYLITYWTYRESTFRHTVKDHQGSYGVGQIQGVLRSRCEKNGIYLITRKDQFRCVASSFQYLTERCGDLEHGLANYASSKCDLKGRPRWVIKDRMRKLKELMKKVEKIYSMQTSKKVQKDLRIGLDAREE